MVSKMHLRDARRVLKILMQLALGGAVVLILGLAINRVSTLTIATGLLWAFAAASVGALTGFLFGIPRVLQSDVPHVGEEDTKEIKNKNTEQRYQVNTNLEQISDWLTKIIVGIGLIELRKIPGAIQSLADYFGSGVPGSNLEAIGGAIVVYFGILGFFLGYLATRLYLAGAFSRADRLMEVGGVEMSGEQVEEQQKNLIGEMLKSLSAVVRTVDPKPTTADGDGGNRAKPRRILWVDDNPSNNGVLISNLLNQGIGIDLATSTQEAIAHLSKGNYDFVITDMGRQESGKDRPEAGLELITQIQKGEFGDPPVVVYTSITKEREVGVKAREAGALAVTSSPIGLMISLGIG